MWTGLLVQPVFVSTIIVGEAMFAWYWLKQQKETVVLSSGRVTTLLFS